jgi:hypothetical protein
MPRLGFEPTTLVLERAAIVIGSYMPTFSNLLVRGFDPPLPKNKSQLWKLWG